MRGTWTSSAKTGEMVTLGSPTQREDGDPAHCPTGPSMIRHFARSASHAVSRHRGPALRARGRAHRCRPVRCRQASEAGAPKHGRSCSGR